MEDPNQMSEEEASALEAELRNRPIDPSRVGHHLRDQNIINSEESMRLASTGPMVKVTRAGNGEIELTMSTGISSKEKQSIMDRMQSDPEGLVAELQSKQMQWEEGQNQKPLVSPLLKVTLKQEPTETLRRNDEKIVAPTSRVVSSQLTPNQLFISGELNLVTLADTVNSCLDCVHALLLGKKLATLESIEKATASYRILHEYYKNILEHIEAANKIEKQRKLMEK